MTSIFILLKNVIKSLFFDWVNKLETFFQILPYLKVYVNNSIIFSLVYNLIIILSKYIQIFIKMGGFEAMIQVFLGDYKVDNLFFGVH